MEEKPVETKLNLNEVSKKIIEGVTGEPYSDESYAKASAGLFVAPQESKE